MKNKFIMFLLIVVFITVLSFGSSITVTNPHSGDTWYKGSSYHYIIRWTKSGTMNSNVKIRLYQGDSRVLAITDSTPNDGEFEWTIPESVVNGTYYIRVKTVDNAVYDNGEEFNIANAPSSSPTITVTNPQSGDTWYKGSSHHYIIRWTKSGTMNSNVKIRLYQGDSRVLAITDSTPNDGEFEWTIPESVVNGTYYIRVKTVDNAVFDNSDEFSIAETTSTEDLHFHGTMLVVRDFELKDIYYVFNRGGWLVSKIKNYGNNFNGDLKFKVYFPDTDLTLSHPLSYTKHLNMRAGEEKNIYLVPSSSVGDVPFCGKRVKVMLDPDNVIRETKENNNSMIKRIYIKNADLSVRRTDLQVKVAYMKSSYRWRVIFKIRVRAGGSGYTSLSNVRVSWEIFPHGGGGSLYSQSFGPFSINHNEEKVFDVNKKFGSPDKKRSIRPRLAEGRYDITLRVSTTERLCERNTRNNTYRFTIHLKK